MVFVNITKPPQRRGWMISIEGPGSTGKTSFALIDTPRPLALIAVDPHALRPLRSLPKYVRQGVSVALHPWTRPAPLPGDDKPGGYSARGVKVTIGEKRTWEAARKLWGGVVDDLQTAIKGPEQAIVLDTGSDLNILNRYAHFGKLKVYPETLYAAPNQTFKEDIIIPCRNSGKTVFIIHKVSAEYVDKVKDSGETVSQQTGAFRRDGFKHLEYYLDAQLQTFYSPTIDKKHPDFRRWTRPKEPTYITRIAVCGERMELAGQILPSDEDGYLDSGWTQVSALLEGEE